MTLSAFIPVFVRTTNAALGDADEIRAGEGDNVVLGGVGGDTIVTGAGRDTVFGDAGQVRFDAKGLVERAESLDTAIGGDDTIEAARVTISSSRASAPTGSRRWAATTPCSATTVRRSSLAACG